MRRLTALIGPYGDSLAGQLLTGTGTHWGLVTSIVRRTSPGPQALKSHPPWMAKSASCWDRAQLCMGVCGPQGEGMDALPWSGDADVG